MDSLRFSSAHGMSGPTLPANFTGRHLPNATAPTGGKDLGSALLSLPSKIQQLQRPGRLGSPPVSTLRSHVALENGRLEIAGLPSHVYRGET